MLAAGDPDTLWAFACDQDEVDDVEVVECLLRRLPDRGPRQAIPAARVAAARRRPSRVRGQGTPLVA